MDGEELRDRRLAAKLTQEELARLVGMSTYSVTRWEKLGVTGRSEARILAVLNNPQDAQTLLHLGEVDRERGVLPVPFPEILTDAPQHIVDIWRYEVLLAGSNTAVRLQQAGW